jgi:hypothetical protein
MSTASALKFTDAGIAYHKSNGTFSNPFIEVDGSIDALEKSITSD